MRDVLEDVHALYHQQVAESPIPSGDRSISLTRAHNSLSVPCLALVAELFNAIQCII